MTKPESDHDKVAKIIEQLDQVRIDQVGGYPSQYEIDAGRVIHADLDAGKEYNAVTLTITPIKKFIAEYEWVFEGVKP